MSKFTFSTGIYILEFFCIDPNRLNYYHWYNQCRHYRTVLFTSRAHKSMQQLQPVINTVTCCTVRLTYFSSPELRSNSSFSILWPFYFGALIISRFSLNISYVLCSCWISNGYIIISSSSLIIYFHCLVCTLMPLFNTINMHFPLTMQPCSSVVLQSRTR